MRLKGLIIKIGDKASSDLKVNLTKMAGILSTDYEKFPDTVSSAFKACITELPMKTPVYGTLLGLLNVKNYEVASKLFDDVIAHTKDCLAKSEWRNVKYLVRFHGELVNANVILPAAYLDLLNDLLAALDEPNTEAQFADCMVYIVLAALPWCGKGLNERKPGELQRLLARIDKYLQKRGTVKTLDLLKSYRGQNLPYDASDPLEQLWANIQKLQNDNWEVPMLLKPYELFDDDLNQALQHELPTFELPQPSPDVQYIAPNASFRIFYTEASTSSFPDPNSISYFILQEIVNDTVHLFESNRKECSKYLLGLYNNFQSGTFAQSPASTDQTNDEEKEDMDTDTSGWILSEVVLELVLGQMLRLPSPPVKQVYYAALIIELCKAESSNYSQTLKKAVHILFERLHDMDVGLIARLWNWFSHHLSNVGFDWDWDAWERALALEPLHPQLCFIRETLEKEVRLSYYDRVKTTLPEKFAVMMASEPPAPSQELLSASHPHNAAAKQLLGMLRQKKDTEELNAVLAELRTKAIDSGSTKEEADEIARNVFTQSVLLLGAKSFSHVLNVIERCLDVLRGLNQNPAERLHTVRIIAQFWKSNTQLLGILLDKFMNYRIIDPTSIISWVFEADQTVQVGRSYIWEILHVTLNKVINRAQHVQTKLDGFRDVHKKNEIARKGSSNESAEAERQQELTAIQTVENSLETVVREQKEVFMVVLQKFTQTLQDMYSNFDARGVDPNSDWTFRWINGWYKDVLRMYHKELSTFSTTLESLVFVSNLDSRIREPFDELKQLNQKL